ncbi:hypothetical protein [Glycocaulis sp.]
MTWLNEFRAALTSGWLLLGSALAALSALSLTSPELSWSFFRWLIFEMREASIWIWNGLLPFDLSGDDPAVLSWLVMALLVVIRGFHQRAPNFFLLISKSSGSVIIGAVWMVATIYITLFVVFGGGYEFLANFLTSMFGSSDVSEAGSGRRSLQLSRTGLLTLNFSIFLFMAIPRSAMAFLTALFAVAVIDQLGALLSSAIATSPPG